MHLGVTFLWSAQLLYNIFPFQCIFPFLLIVMHIDTFRIMICTIVLSLEPVPPDKHQDA